MRIPASGTPLPDSAREQPWSALLPAPETRRKLWAQLAGALEKYTEEVAGHRVTPELAYAADRAVTATRNKAEASSTRVAASNPTTP